ARGSYEVLIENVEHRRTGDAREKADLKKREHSRGLDQRGQPRPETLRDRGISRRRKPAERDAEENDGQDAEPEARQGYADQRRHHDKRIEPGIAPIGGEHAKYDSGLDGDRQR